VGAGIKAALVNAYPGVISCADIVVLAAEIFVDLPGRRAVLESDAGAE
jgi:hypothetical protein